MKKRFNRSTIQQQDLVKEVAADKPEGIFHSSWAKEVEEQLSAANWMEGDPTKEKNTDRDEIQDDSDRRRRGEEFGRRKEDQWRQDREEVWEVLKPRRQTEKVRKPIEIKCWFGDEQSSGSDSGSNDSDWTDVERKQKNEEKRKRTKLRKKQKMEETLLKARGMLGVGPVTEELRNKFNKTSENKETIRREIVIELLKHHIDFNDSEIAELDIKETQEGKDDYIYFAASGQEMLKEIFICKAESRNDDLLIRNYVPPQLYRRYMAINRVCKDKRAEHGDLKTQIRFGTKDIEIFTKWRGSGEGFKKTSLLEFMGDEETPEFDDTVKWRKRVDRPTRRVPNYNRRETATKENTGNNSGHPAGAGRRTLQVL